MAKLQVEKVCEMAKKGFDARDNNRQLFEEVYELTIPFRNTFANNGQMNGQTSFNKPSALYDSTAMIAANNFVNTMQANFTPVFTRWAELKAGPGIPEAKRNKINKELSKITDIIFTYLNASNFNTAAAEMFYDWGIGTGNMWVFEGDQERPLNFVATPMSEMGLVEGRYGTVDGKFRQHKIKGRLLKYNWPGEKVKLNGDLNQIIKDKPDEDVMLVEACYYDYADFVWRYEVIHEESQHRLIEKVWKEEVCLTPRWMKIPGFPFGIGPFILALADAKTLNKMKEFMLRSAALNIFGVYTVANNGGFNPNNIKIEPLAFIPVERNAGPNGPTIQSLPRTGDFNAEQFMVENLQDSVRKTMLDNRLPQETPQPKTAFEIAERIKEFQQDIGSAYGRAMYEFVQPLFRRVVGILQRKGLIQWPEGFDIDNYFIQVQVVSPIAQTQALEDVQKFLQTYQIVANVNPQLAMMAYEIEKLPSWLTEKTGAPSALLRDDAQYEQIKAAVMNLVQQQAAAAQAQGGPQALPAGALQAGSTPETLYGTQNV